MSSFFEELWESIFTPGPTPTILRATNITFAALQVLLGVLLVATRSIHFVILSVLSACLWRAINWFAGEVVAAQAREERDEKEKEKEKQEEEEERGRLKADDSDTEVERSQQLQGADKEMPGGSSQGESRDVEPVERVGEVKLRVVAMEPPRSSASTEDEWERISENEDGKGK